MDSNSSSAVTINGGGTLQSPLVGVVEDFFQDRSVNGSPVNASTNSLSVTGTSQMTISN